IGSAFVNHLDDVTGSVEPGKLADLVVLGRDPFSGTPAEIANTHGACDICRGRACLHRAGLWLTAVLSRSCQQLMTR
ncbi:MAG: hypothetical protein ACTHKL_05575, partial [Streptosporangiaceae bacterium]